MHRTAGTGPSSMMAAAVVTAATCAQEEKIQKHITPTETGNIFPALLFPLVLAFYSPYFLFCSCLFTEHSVKAKKLCEMATQTIALSSIFASLDGNAYNQIPYADQYVPNNTTTATPTAEASDEQVVVNNNKINQQQHGQPAQAGNHIASNPAAATVTTTPIATATTVATVTTSATAAADAAIAPAEATATATSNGSRRGPVLQTNL